MPGFDPNAPFTAAPATATAPAAPPAFNPSAAYTSTAVMDEPEPAPAFDPAKPFAAAAPTSAISRSGEQPKPEPTGIAGKVWDWLNSPLLSNEGVEKLGDIALFPGYSKLAQSFDQAAAANKGSKLFGAAEGVKTGAENFVAGLSSPTSLALAVASMGEGPVAEALAKIPGISEVQAAGAVKRASLVANLGFLTKYGYDLGTTSIPGMLMAWGDYRAAKTDKDKQKALDRFSDMATENVFGAIAAGLATKGIGHDLNELRAASPKGKAMAQEHYSNGIHDYQEENQVGIGQARQDFDQYRKMVPDEARRVAIARSIEAGADPNVLEAQAKAAEANPKTADTAKEFRAAKNLSDTEIQVRDEIRNKLAADLAHLKALDLLPEDGGKANYLPHKWDVEDIDPDTGKPVVSTLTDGDRDMLKKRKFDSIAEGEQKGLKPTTKDAVALIADYHERVSNLIAKNNLAEKLAGSYTNEGAPMAAPGHLFPGFTRPVDAPVDPAEVANLKAAGKFDALLKSGRIYEVPGGRPETTLTGEAAGAGKAKAGPQQTVEEAGGVFRGAKAGLVEVTLPEDVANKLTTLDPRMRKFVSVTVPEEGLTAEKIQDAMAKKFQEMGGSAQDAQFLKTTRPGAPNYKWKQSDYVPSGLAVWRPVSASEANELPKETAIVPFGKGPFPEQAIMEKGQAGIPGVPAEENEKIANARVPVYVAPEVAPHLESVLESTRPKNALVRAILKVSSEAKSDLLSLSPFHWATILNRTLESGLNPFRGGNRKFVFMPRDIDYYNLTDSQRAAIRNGVVVSSTRPGFSGYLSEGLGAGHESIINKIPLVGDFNHAIEGKLFGPHGWITSLKFDLYDKLTPEIKAAHPELTDEQAGRIAASQVNNKFGGLNYTVLGRGASTQNTLRTLLLAPDFLESTGRSVLDVAGKHGGPMLKSLVAFNVAHWMLARGINYLVSGDTRPEAGFSVLSKNGKREYSLRTTLGDFLHFAEKPRDFLANRVNPLMVRAPAEIAYGEDQMGHKVTDAQKFFDTLRQITPIPLQGLYPNQQISQPSALDKVLQSTGVGSRKHFTPAETLAYQFASKRGEEAPLEGKEIEKAQLRYRLEDTLRSSIVDRDNAGRVQAMKAIHEASSGPKAKLTATEASEIIGKAHKYPSQLQGTVARLGLADTFQVWDKAGLTERRALRPLIQSKIDKWMLSTPKRTREENQDMRERIRAFRFSLAE
jgi:hypothetical protein